MSSKTVDEIVTFLIDDGLAERQALSAVEGFIDDGVLVPSEDSFERDSPWERYNWREAKFLNQGTRNEVFADHSDLDDEVREVVLQEYLVERPNSQSEELHRGPNSIALPTAESETNISLLELLRSRKTTRAFVRESIDVATLSSVLGDGLAAYRTKMEEETASIVDHGLASLMKSLFSAIEIYVIAHRVTGLAIGKYRYGPVRHELQRLAAICDEDEADEIVVGANWGQAMPRGVAFSIFLVANFERYMWQYRYSRAYRNMFISIGELGQALLLAGQAEGLNSCMTPAIRDTFVDEQLSLGNLNRQAVYYLGFGK
jgi:SagB-type dehydrogenase family enzyme